MSIPLQWIDRIFEKLTLNYGVEFMNRFKGLDIASVKTDWCHELSSVGDRPDAIKHALSNLPDRPPTAQQFRNLCGQYHAPEKAIALPHLPAPNPERLAEVMSRLAVPVQKHDSREWARNLLQRHTNGSYPSTPAALQMARTALGQE